MALSSYQKGFLEKVTGENSRAKDAASGVNSINSCHFDGVTEFHTVAVFVRLFESLPWFHWQPQLTFRALVKIPAHLQTPACSGSTGSPKALRAQGPPGTEFLDREKSPRGPEVKEQIALPSSKRGTGPRTSCPKLPSLT